MDTPSHGNQLEEAWVPDSLQARLTVGAKVRVRLRGECDRENMPGSHYQENGIRGHALWLDGKTGVISEPYLGHPSPYPSHPYFVRWDEPYLIEERRAVGEHFAAAELEPLEETL